MVSAPTVPMESVARTARKIGSSERSTPRSFSESHTNTCWVPLDAAPRVARPSDAGDESNMSYELIEADQDFLRTFRMELAAGRDFSLEMGDETAGAVIINREAVKGLGLSDPVAANISKIKPVQPKKVIGVAKDFHMESLHVPIRPVLISLGQFEPYQYLSCNLSCLLHAKQH